MIGIDVSVSSDLLLKSNLNLKNAPFFFLQDTYRKDRSADRKMTTAPSKSNWNTGLMGWVGEGESYKRFCLLYWCAWLSASLVSLLSNLIFVWLYSLPFFNFASLNLSHPDTTHTRDARVLCSTINATLFHISRLDGFKFLKSTRRRRPWKNWRGGRESKFHLLLGRN